MVYRCMNCNKLVELPVPYARVDSRKANMMKQIKLEICPNCKNRVYSEKELKKEINERI